MRACFVFLLLCVATLACCQSRGRLDIGLGSGLYLGGSLTVAPRWSADVVVYTGEPFDRSVRGIGFGVAYHDQAGAPAPGRVHPFVGLRVFQVDQGTGIFASSSRGRWSGPWPVAGVNYGMQGGASIGLHLTPLPAVVFSVHF